jgi:uncharacterized Fe-S cluster protein YjdI
MTYHKKYSNGEITVFWKPEKCVHSTRCFTGLPEVFNPQKRPWINMNASTTAAIIKAVSNCPSGALTYKKEINMSKEESKQSADVKIEPLANGPLLIHGKYVLVDKGRKEVMKEGTLALCRCGGSKNKPMCDGTHQMIDFKA